MKKMILIIFMAFSMSVFAQNTITHIVKKGETMESIAKKYGVKVSDILKVSPNTAKNLKSGKGLIIGQRLNIPPKAKKSTSKQKSTTTIQPKVNTNTKSQERSQQIVQSNESIQPISDNRDVQPEINTSSKFQDDKKVNTTKTWGQEVTPSFLHTNQYQNNLLGTYLGVFYIAQSFQDIKTSGFYGLMAERYGDWDNIGLSIWAGLNVGLIDFDFSSYSVALGPNYSYQFAERCIAILPASVVLNLDRNDNISWGWCVNPKVGIYIDKHAEAQLGLFISGGFKGGQVNCGFSFSVGSIDFWSR